MCALHDVISDGNKLAKRGLEESASGKTCEKRAAERGGLTVHVAPVSLDESSWIELKVHFHAVCYLAVKLYIEVRLHG